MSISEFFLLCGCVESLYGYLESLNSRCLSLSCHFAALFYSFSISSQFVLVILSLSLVLCVSLPYLV